MLNQRGIRKSALLLLYAMEAQRVTPESQETFPFDAYWTLVSENDNKRYARALAKAVLHEIRAYDELLTLLQARTTAFCAAAATLTKPQTLPARAQELLNLLQTLPEPILYLRRQTEKAVDEQRDEELRQQSEKVIHTCEKIHALAEDILSTLESETRGATEAYAAALRRVQKACAGCAQLAHPDRIKPRHEHADLVHYTETLNQRRPLTEQLAKTIYARRQEWEKLLHDLLRNYVPDRLNVLDRCILYIAFYDFVERDLDPGIVISEACLLADEYSGGKSAPFIHGIIATAIMQLKPSPLSIGMRWRPISSRPTSALHASCVCSASCRHGMSTMPAKLSTTSNSNCAPPSPPPRLPSRFRKMVTPASSCSSE